MPNAEEDFLLVRKSISKWVTEIVLSNASGYFDINRISEGIALKLLNLVFDYELIDLNLERINYPGIDLGDYEVSKLAFQVTSQSTNAKILSSLRSFRKENYKEQFPNGVKFFIINNTKKSKKYIKGFEDFSDIFNPKTDIVYPQDLVEIIKNIYHRDEVRFAEIRKFLIKEFGENEESEREELISFENSGEKISFYNKIFSSKHEINNANFVSFVCKINGEESSTEDLEKLLDGSNGLFLVGPSGCGKSILSKNIALTFCKQNLSVVLESKYYDTNLDAFLEKEICNLGFKNSLEFFKICYEQKQVVLLIIDGFNECDDSKKSQLIAELEKLSLNWTVKFILSSQREEQLVAPLELLKVEVDYPSITTKIEIVTKLSKSIDRPGIESLLSTISTSLEAKIIGEMEILNIDDCSRFSLFDNFIKQKLEEEKLEAFSLMAIMAKNMSNKFSFSLSEREIEIIFKEHNLSASPYNKCLESQILDSHSGRVSFAHEMFFKFFIAESIIRFSNDIECIIKEINLPKNYDNKLFIVGSINDREVLEAVLTDIKDVDFLNSIISGEAGSYSQKWCKRKLNEALYEIESEINNIQFIFTEADFWGIGYEKRSLTSWSEQQLAFITLIAYQLFEENILKRFYEIVGKMDDKIVDQTFKLDKIAERDENILLKDSLFSSAYVGLSNNTSAVTKIVNMLHSGILIFDQGIVITDESINYIISRKSITYGQFYFILSFLRWNYKLSAFFELTCNLLEKQWASLPYHLKLDILVNIRHFSNSEEEKNILINILNDIHQKTNNVWMSSTIFDALNQLGALDQDAEEQIPFISDEINGFLSQPDLDENCQIIFGLYNRTYDHPYSIAYQEVISALEEKESKIFYEMAIKGMNDVFLGSYLIIDTANIIGEKICPHIVRWTEVPIFHISMPQDSLQIFIISHILLAKFKYPLVSRFKKETDMATKSLFAAAEIYYWYSRPDLDDDDKRKYSQKAADLLFNDENIFAISTISALRESLLRHPIAEYVGNIFNNTIENWYCDILITICKRSLDSLNVQKNVTRLGNDINIETIYMLERIGNVLDIDILKRLSGHKSYGQVAVKAIKILLTAKN
ncbi:SMEK domain-containing protein [Chryseobacterium sp. Ch-15]|uniref:SMEK domain-containing protein n=1 Tax=Chryseobacterium muglaense TaxID=2893752 RepID=A0A9Q3YXI6_9FLAO|nr:SMEK domain-containing protein [Chryseobacterium muglaense]MBD3905410.1 SMEK domain-containing protein [Chryseobacterium muglaense]MCC9036865.1 SMEK domain-containing protein [Chryseobacterium muglaense]MCM2555273.1 SMEK domain-containing protein [Chryseobacterium muglaense]